MTTTTSRFVRPSMFACCDLTFPGLLSLDGMCSVRARHPFLRSQNVIVIVCVRSSMFVHSLVCNNTSTQYGGFFFLCRSNPDTFSLFPWNPCRKSLLLSCILHAHLRRCRGTFNHAKDFGRPLVNRSYDSIQHATKTHSLYDNNM